MIRHRLLRVTTAALLVLGVARGALAGPPTEQLRGKIDGVVKILTDPALKGEGKTRERRQAIRNISNQIFDWPEMAKRSLGRHWQGRTEAEHREFVTLFRDLLERSYISTIERYSGEEITYLGDSVESDQATVRTKLITKTKQEVPLDYRMLRRGDRWLIYDVIVENVGLVSSYRTQFNQIIQTSSYEELLKKMKSSELVRKA